MLPSKEILSLHREIGRLVELCGDMKDLAAAKQRGEKEADWREVGYFSKLHKDIWNRYLKAAKRELLEKNKTSTL